MSKSMTGVHESRIIATAKRLQFSRWMVWLFLAASILLLLYTYYRAETVYQGTRDGAYFKYYIISLTSALFWGVVLRLKEEIRVNILMATTSLVVGLYLVEVILYFSGLVPKIEISDPKFFERKTAAAEQGIAFDARTKHQIIQDLRDGGEDAFPQVGPTNLIQKGGLNKEGAELLFPLGRVANKTTVGTNESGKYMIFRSDRYGFNNPDVAWDPPWTEWALTGDSFTEGVAVQTGEDIGGQIRSLTNQSVINLGISGNGPLAELAVLKEYAEPMRPKKVLWVYCEGNDLTRNLSAEKTAPILMEYLQPEFSQDLIHKQKEIDSRLTNFIAEEKAKAEAKAKADREGEAIVYKLLRLYHMRSLIETDVEVDVDVDVDPLFAEILTEARDRTAAWGGQLYFVYLPDFSRYAASIDDHDLYRKRREVIDMVKRLKIRVIDIHQEVFENHHDLLSLFPFRTGGHYNAEGYREVAKAIIAGVSN